ncbi:MAG: tRNA lysidine(34) synthetase TilS [Desulfobacterales bacterium]
METQFIATVKQTLVHYAMLKKSDRVLVGLSGGGDSVALLDVLVRLSPRMGFEVGAAHLNHGLRPEAQTEAQWVAQWAARFEIPFFSDTQPVAAQDRKQPGSLEEAAREVRHRYLQNVARNHGFGYIALGHHLDDNAESVLMFLLRGAGPDGLKGIPPVGRFSHSAAVVIRPLLGVCRVEIESYLESRHLPKLVDPSNRDPAFTRNRIRHHLLPLLIADYNPRIRDSLNRLAAILSAESAWLDPVVRRRLTCLARPISGNGLEIEVYALKQMPPGLLRRIIRQAILKVKGDLRRIGYDHVAHIIGLLADCPRPKAVDLPGGIRCRRVGSALTICPISRGEVHRRAYPPITTAVGASAVGYLYRVPAPGQDHSTQVIVPEIGCQLIFSCLTAKFPVPGSRPGQSRAFFDMDRIQFPLKIRNVQPGDRFRPLGGRRENKVRQFLHDHQTPLDSREMFPLLLSGIEIIWLVGLAVGQLARPRPDSQKLLKVDCMLVS